jgi:pentatricopeptide repeat protein
MFSAAQELGLPIDEKTYTNMLSFYGKAGKHHEASLLFSRMKEDGIRPGKVFLFVSGKARNGILSLEVNQNM